MPRPWLRLLHAGWLHGLVLAWLSVLALPVRALGLEAALGERLGLHAEVLVEDAGPLTLDAAREARQRGEFRPARQPVLAHGLGARPVWQRLELDNADTRPRELQLVAGMTWVDRVDVYIVRPDGLVQHWQAGDELASTEHAEAGLGLVFPLALAPGRSELWVRAETPDPMLVPLRLLDQARLQNLERVQHYGYGLLYGFLLALMAYNAMLFSGLRERSHLYYAAYLMSFIAVNLGYTGHGWVWLWPGVAGLQRYAILALMVWFGVCGLLFSTRFLDVRLDAPRLWRRLMVLPLLGLLGMAWLALLDLHRPAVWFAFGFLALTTGLIVALGVWAWRRRKPAAGYFLAAALCGMGGTLATMLSVWGGLPWNEFTFHAIDAGIMAEATLLALALAARLRHQQQAREQAERLARLDPLTGLYNRRAFLELAQGHFQAALRSARPMCALMLDVDHFKAINDRFGHDVGDLALSEVGQLLQRSCRAADLLARWGGEEFLLLLPDTRQDEGLQLAERIRLAVSQLSVCHRGEPVLLTASLGLATLAPGRDLAALVGAADAALYAAKQAGRNRVALADAAAPAGA